MLKSNTLAHIGLLFSRFNFTAEYFDYEYYTDMSELRVWPA